MSEQRPFGAFFRALGEGYGSKSGPQEDKALRKHLAWCNGVNCEEPRCEVGKKWRSTRPEAKWAKIDGREHEQPTIHESQPRMVQGGNGRETLAGNTGEEQAEDREPVSLPTVPESDRTGERETRTEDGADTRQAEAASQAEQMYGAGAKGSRRVQAWTRPSTQPSGSENRKPEPVSSGTETVQALRLSDNASVGEGNEAKVAKTARRVKKGRPRKWASDQDRMRAGARAYRQRKRQRKSGE